jgi:translation initiation factor 2 gamma subunit (eIF-2gamma)
MTTIPALQKVLKEIIHTENKDKHSDERMVINKSHQLNR